MKYFAPLKKMAKQDFKGQESTWLASLFWQLPDITPEAQQELGVDGGILGSFQAPDQRSARDRQEGKPPAYAFPHRAGASTRRVHKVAYSGEVVVCERWREEFGKEIDNPDQHFRLVYLTSRPEVDDDRIASELQEERLAVLRPETLAEDTREALADLMAAEQMKRNCAAPNQSTLREYADGKRREAVKALLNCQQDEYRRGKVITQKGYGIPASRFLNHPSGVRTISPAGCWTKPMIRRCSVPGSCARSSPTPTPKKSSPGSGTKTPPERKKTP